MRFDPPLDPTAAEAREWLRNELSRGEYAHHESWWERVRTWFTELIDRIWHSLPTVDGPGFNARWLLWLVGLAVLALIVLLLGRSVRLSTAGRRRAHRQEGVLEGDVRTAAQLRAAARSAFAAGDHDAAVLAAYRALARSAVDRTLLEDQPGRTAREVATGLAPAFVPYADALLTASRTFDAVRYGHLRAIADQARQVMEVEQSIESARPDFAALTNGPQP